MDIKLSNGAKIILSLLEMHGHRAYAVGGCVRDQIMGKDPFDFDITTDATAEEMLKIFSDYKTLTTGIKHGTISVIIDKEIFECTTFRIDGEYTDSRHPDRVTFSRNLKEDLSRRDFTINALCYNETDGLTDLFNGISDINNKVIRCIGEAEKRFNEDALRILRGMRFASTLGFSIDADTKNAMIKCSSLLKHISKERITEEFRKMLVGKNLRYVLENLSSVLSIVLPGIKTEPSLIKKIIESPPDFEYRMALIQKENKENTDIFCKLRFSNLTALSITELSQMKIPESKSELKRMLNKYKEANVIKYIDCIGDRKIKSWYKEIKSNNECYRLDALDISGKDILNLGIEPKHVGSVLNTLLNKVINEEIENKKNELLKAVR